MSLCLTIEKLVPGGDGLARHEGQVVLVPSVLPAEVIEVEITEDKKQYLRALPLKILKSSPARVKPPCPIYNDCGGCHWQHIEYGEQLQLKKQIIKDAFSRTGKLELPDFEIVQSSPWGYRNRAQLQVNAKEKKLGFMRRKTIDIIEVEHCAVLAPAINNLLKEKPSSITSGKSSKVHLFSTTTGQLSTGHEIVKLKLLGKSIEFDNRCFFQSNLSLLETFIQHALQDLKGETAVDLYSGVGLFALFLADNFKRCILVEENSHSLKFAKKNLQGKQAEFFPLSVEKFFGGQQLPECDVVVVDPPRNGISQSAKKALLAAKPKKLVYVSCNPVTQARDSRDILAAGYKMDSFKAFDFYPQTFHIETVQKFSLN